MSYVVMECHPGYVVLLDEEGRFLKAANLRYEVGQRDRSNNAARPDGSAAGLRQSRPASSSSLGSAITRTIYSPTHPST